MSDFVHDMPVWVLSQGRLLIWLTLLSAVFVPLERLFALRSQKIWRRQIMVDPAYYFIKNTVVTAIVAVPLGMAAYAAHIMACAVPGLVVGEVFYYWIHRLSHEVPFLWRFHAIHHSAESMDFQVNTRGHPVDLFIARMVTLMPVYALGLANPASTSGGMIGLFITLVGTFWSFLIHANLRREMRPLRLLITTPAFHHWHHTSGGVVNRNYAAMLPMMDRIFGTYYLPKSAWPEAYGVDTPVPANLPGQFIWPFGK